MGEKLNRYSKEKTRFQLGVVTLAEKAARVASKSIDLNRSKKRIIRKNFDEFPIDGCGRDRH